jgi:predicted ATP-dependent serine protease
MTKNTHTKTAVRARMAVTGENYLTAYRALFEQTMYASPWPEMNRILGGGYRAGLHVIGAPQKTGKSLIIRALAANSTKPVLVAGTEVREKEFWDNTAVDLYRFGGEDLMEASGGQYVDELKKKISFRSGFVHQVTGKNVFGLLDEIENQCEITPFGAVFFDSLQSVTGSRDEIDQFTRALKLFANKYDIPVFLTSQMPRPQENGIPRASELASSSAVEQDADTVTLLSRQYTLKSEHTEPTFTQADMVEWLRMEVVKNRYGQTESIQVKKDEIFS